jgi:hypothetical protein
MQEEIPMFKFAALAGLGALAIVTVSPKWTATLAPTGGSQVAGTATVEPLERRTSLPLSDSTKAVLVDGKDSVRASISIKGGTANSSQAWHVHAGNCGAIGSVVGAMTSYPAITVGSDGSGTAVATIPGGLGAGDHVVAVHQGSAETATVACGALRPNAIP